MASESIAKTTCLRILMVEDEMLLAMVLEDTLQLLGCEVVKASHLRKALRLAQTADLDGALLDVNLCGERVYPAAAALDRRGIPYMFMTGYGSDMVEAGFRHHPILHKPFELDEIKQMMTAMVG